MVLTLTAACLAVACASQLLRQYLEDYQGRSVQALISALGPPDSRGALPGKRLYIWASSSGAAVGCKVTVTTDESDTIIDSQYVGDKIGCSGYRDKLVH